MFSASKLLHLMNAPISILPFMIFQGSICDSRHEESHLLLCVFCFPSFWGQATKQNVRLLLQIKREKLVLTVTHQCSCHNSHGMNSTCMP